MNWTTYIEAIGFHAPAWGQRWSKLTEVVPLTCNVSLHPFLISNSPSSVTHI
jgi:hypothetical protein